MLVSDPLTAGQRVLLRMIIRFYVKILCNFSTLTIPYQPL